MAPSPTGTTVARVGPSSGTTKTTATFNAPANSIVVVLPVVDSTGGSNPGLTITNNGAALTWELIARRGSEEVADGARPGTVAAYYAVITGARSGLTVTATCSISGRSTTLKVYSVTGVDLADPIGGVIEGSVTVGNNVLTTAPAMITEVADSLAFVTANESEVGPGNPTGPDSTAVDAYNSAGNHSGLTGYRVIPDAGTSVRFDVDAAGTSTAISWNYVVFEVRPAVTGTAHTRTLVDPVGVTDTAAQTSTAIRTVVDPVSVGDEQAAEFGDTFTISLALTSTASGTAGDPSGGSWDDTTGATNPRVLGAAPAGAPAELAVTETNATADWDVLLGTWVSAPLLRAGDIPAGAATRLVFARRSNAGAGLRARYRMYVIDSAGAVRGSSYNKLANSAGFNETANPLGLDIATTTTGAVACQIGDRVVVELGFRQTAATATAATGSVWAGGVSGTPQTAGGTSIDDHGFVEFEATTPIFVAAGVAHTRTVTDPIGVADTAVGAQGHVRTITDPVALADLVVASTTSARTITDPVGLVDVAAQASAAARTLADPVGIGDTAASSTTSVRTLADPVGLADVAASVAEHVRPIIDPLGITDTAASSSATERTIVDPVGLADQHAADIGAGATYTDPVGLGDTVEQTTTSARTPADPVGITDVVLAAQGHVRVIIDPVGIGDTAGGAQAHNRDMADAVGVLDTVASSSTTERSVVDPVGLLDTAASSSVTERAVVDPVGVGDDAIGAQGWTRDLTDPVGIGDQPDQATTAARTIADPVGLVDTAAGAQGHGREIVDPVGLADPIDDERTRVVEIVDPIGIGDTAAPAQGHAREVADPVGLIDQADQAQGHGRDLVDPVGIGDHADQASSAARTVTDPVGLADQAESAQGHGREVADPVGVGDVAEQTAEQTRELADPVGVADTAASVGGRPAVLVPGKHAATGSGPDLDATSSTAGLDATDTTTRLEAT